MNRPGMNRPWMNHPGMNHPGILQFKITCKQKLQYYKLLGEFNINTQNVPFPR